MAQQLAPWRWGRSDGGPLAQLHSEMDRLFDDFFRGVDLPSPLQWTRGLLTPQVDVCETEKAFEVRAELPGVEEKDLDVTFADGALTIKGEKKSEKEEKDKRFHRVERSYGTFERTLSLGENVDPDKIEADFKNGVLTVTVPKKAPAQSAVKKIQVRGGR